MAIVAAVDSACEVFQHIPCFPGQIIMTNTKFQRDSLAQSLPGVKFSLSLYLPRPVRERGSGGKPRDMYQVTHLAEVPTRLETVVKLGALATEPS